MALISLVSLGIFISLGWVKRPSGRRTGQTLGRGLIEATRAPAQIVGAVFEMSTMPLRATGTKLRQVADAALPADAPRPKTRPDDQDDAPHHGSE
jgi:hypothetical protein